MSRVYDSKTWKLLRRKFLREHPFCGACAWEGRQTPATEVDHAVPIGQGGEPFDERNLVGYCKPHHSAKTRLVDTGKRKSVPVRGVDAKTGRPKDGSHWWNAKEEGKR